MNHCILFLFFSFFFFFSVSTEAHIGQVKENLAKASHQLIPAVFTNT